MTISERCKKTNNISFLCGQLWKKILLFVLPIAVMGMIQQLFHSADAAVVGRFVGKEALAAVGGTTPLVNLVIEFFIGLSNASNIVVARFTGQDNRERTIAAVHTAISVAFISGIFVGVIGVFLSQTMLACMHMPPDILFLSTKYLRIYFIGMPFFMLNNFSAAVFRGFGNAKKPLLCFSVGGFINVLLNLFFVLVLHAGVEGTAWATVISSGVSTVLFVGLLIKEDAIHLDTKRLRIDRAILVELAKIGLPAGFLGSVFSISNVCMQSAINMLGTDTVSANSAAVNIEIYLQFIINAFAQTTTTAVGQNSGAKQAARCRNAIKTALLLCVITTIILSGAVYLSGRHLLYLFVTDAAVISLAMTRMQYTVVFKFIQSIMDVTSGALQGYGYTLVPALISVFGVCGVRLFWIFSVFPGYQTLGALMVIYPITQGIAACFYIILVCYRTQKEFRVHSM